MTARYNTQVRLGTCGCPAFLESRFLICKHIVACYETVKPSFFRNVRRITSAPYWTADNLVIRPQYTLPNSSMPAAFHFDDINASLLVGSQTRQIEEIDKDDLVDLEDDDDDDDEVITDNGPLQSVEENSLNAFTEIKELLQFASNLVDDEQRLANHRFGEKFLSSLRKLKYLKDDVQRRRARRTRPLTWTSENKHEVTMYLKSC